MFEFEYGPYYDNTLISPSGKLTRLHKGGGTPDIPPPPAPPPKKATKAVATVTTKKESEARKFGRPDTVLKGKPKLSTDDQLSKKNALSAVV